MPSLREFSDFLLLDLHEYWDGPLRAHRRLHISARHRNSRSGPEVRGKAGQNGLRASRAAGDAPSTGRGGRRPGAWVWRSRRDLLARSPLVANNSAQKGTNEHGTIT